MLQFLQLTAQIFIVRDQRRKQYERIIEREAPDMDPARRTEIAKEAAHQDYSPEAWTRTAIENKHKVPSIMRMLGIAALVFYLIVFAVIYWSSAQH